MGSTPAYGTREWHAWRAARDEDWRVRNLDADAVDLPDEPPMRRPTTDVAVDDDADGL